MNIFDEVIGWFTNPENWSGYDSIPVRLVEHIGYSALALAVAFAIAFPLGMILGHLHRGQAVVLTIANVVRALPTLGLLTLMVILAGIGLLPPMVALIVLAIPPILVNTFEGIRFVDARVVDAARGVGMREGAILFRVEMPIALPIIFLGIRLAAIQVVASATIAAYVGLGGLGRFIFDGLGRQDFPMMAGGSVIAALLAILTEVAFVLVAKFATSPGVVGKERFRLSTHTRKNIAS